MPRIWAPLKYLRMTGKLWFMGRTGNVTVCFRYFVILLSVTDLVAETPPPAHTHTHTDTNAAENDSL